MRLFVCAASVLAFSGLIFASSTGAPAGTAGVSGEGSCIDCHGTALNSGPGRVRVALVDASSYQPGQKVRLRVTLEDPNAARWGFNLTARTTGDANAAAGTFTLSDTANTRLVVGAGNIQFITHNATGTRRGTSTSSSWEVDWTGPEAGGSVTFYVAGNAANNNGQADGGDRIYTSSLAVNSASAVSTTPKVMPRFEFGGGSYSAIYLHNSSTATAAVTVSFFGNDGSPLSVGALGGATSTANVPAGGITFLEAPNSGDLQQGWARIDLPEGVTGYGVLRRSAEGRADLETVVTLAGASSAKSSLIFDDSGLTTSIAAVNPTDSAVTVTATAKSDSGTTLGTATFDLPAKGRAAFPLRDRIAEANGQRGTVEFSVPSGAVSIHGLRSNGEAFTTIPVTER